MKFFALLLSLFSVAVFAAPIQITDSRGKLTFDEPPKRVVIINWALTEQVLDLGVQPVGIADIKGFRQQGGRLDDASGIVDIGTRAAPDLNKIRALKPDMILVGYSQRPLLHQLENLGTVVYFKSFGHRWNNAEKARERFLLLGRLLGKSDAAQQRLARYEQTMQALKQRLQTQYKNDLPKVTMLVPQGRSYWLFANNSMPYYAAEALGLQVSADYPPSKFGVKKLGLNDLPKILGCVLVFEAGGNTRQQTIDALKEKTDCLHELTPVSVYGGAISIEYLAKSIVQALLQK